MKTIKFLALLLLVGFMLLLLGLYAFQDRLLFHPQALDPSNERQLKQNTQIELLDITTEALTGQIHLRGWLLKQKEAATERAATQRLVIYFGGNGDELSWMALDSRLPRHVSWAFINYRGYGQSEGVPSEAALFADALRFYDYFTQTRGYQPQHIMLMGRSLGTGVAVYLASQRPVAKLLLITPYDSIAAVAQGHIPWLPIRWLLKHPFDSYARAPVLRNPVTILAAEHDRTIPPEHAHRLHEVWGGPKQWRMVNSDHNGIFEHVETWQIIRDFLS